MFVIIANTYGKRRLPSEVMASEAREAAIKKNFMAKVKLRLLLDPNKQS